MVTLAHLESQNSAMSGFDIWTERTDQGRTVQYIKDCTTGQIWQMVPVFAE